MKRYNFFRPLLIIIVAFAANNLAKLVCQLLGVNAETTETVAVGVMVIAALAVFLRLNRTGRK